MVEQALAQTDIHDNKQSNNLFRKRPLLSVGLGLILLMILAVIVSIWSGRLAVIVKNPDQKVFVQSAVCGEEVVKQYNAAMTLYSQGSKDQGLNDLKTVTEGVVAKQHYEKDPTCMYIAYYNAAITTDYAVAKEKFDKYQALLQQGSFADGRLMGLVSLGAMQSFLDIIKPEDMADND